MNYIVKNKVGSYWNFGDILLWEGIIILNKGEINKIRWMGCL